MRSEPFFGRAFGLRVESDIDLPGMFPSPRGPADVRIHIGTAESLGPTARTFLDRFEYTPDAVRVCFPETGAIIIREGVEIEIEAPAGHSAASLHLCIMGTAFGFLLNQRGRLVLHGSAVCDRDRAVLFLGPSGSGKSTLAAACLREGFQLITDDVVAIDVDAQPPAVVGGVRNLKLWPDSLLALGLDPEALPVLEPGLEKRFVWPGEVVQEAFAVETIYCLDEAPEIAISQLTPGERIAQLVRNSYVNSVLPLGEGERHLRQIAKLVSGTRLRALRRPRMLEAVAETVLTIRADLSSLG